VAYINFACDLSDNILSEYAHALLHLNQTSICPNKTSFYKDLQIYCVTALKNTHRNLSEEKFMKFLKFGIM
jgi:hypothetical protein